MTPKISVLSSAERRRVFGDFPYRELGGGRIKIDSDWIVHTILGCRLARTDGKGKDVLTSCHRLAKEPLELAFTEIAERGLWRLIHSFDGLWVPRHMTWNPHRPLSSHSWGIAFDLNAETNPYGGEVSAETRALNEVFNHYGFAWGGDWNGDKDAMHWELADVEAWKQWKETKARAPRLILAIDRSDDFTDGFSYHEVPGTSWDEGHFIVDVAEVAGVAGKPASSGQQPMVGRMPLREALHKLGLKMLKVGDHLSDAHDPRCYAFVK
jgi:hypothetical protein